MREIILSDKTIQVDTSKVTMGEWREFFSGKQTHKKDDEFIEKATGLTPKEQQNMLRNDYRRLIKVIVQEGTEPLTDPN